MHDRIAKHMGYFYRRRRGKFLIVVIFTAVCFSVAAASFTYHAYLTISRYMKHEILQSSITTQNDSLFMPVVGLQLLTMRNSKSVLVKPPIEMKFDTSLDNQKLPLWAFSEYHIIYQHLVTANQIKNTAFLQENFTLENAKFTVFGKVLH